MARLGLFGRIGKAIAKLGDAVADAVNPGRPSRAARQKRETKRFARGGRVSGKAAERYAQERRDAEATARANQARRRREGRQGPPRVESDYQRRKREASERATRDRQRARERDPYLSSWNTLSNRAGYLDHRDFFQDKIVGPADLDAEEQLELWQDYIRYMTRSNNAYRLNTLNNPFWAASGMHPDDFDWYGWREAMGYEHGARK